MQIIKNYNQVGSIKQTMENYNKERSVKEAFEKIVAMSNEITKTVLSVSNLLSIDPSNLVSLTKFNDSKIDHLLNSTEKETEESFVESDPATTVSSKDRLNSNVLEREGDKEDDSYGVFSSETKESAKEVSTKEYIERKQTTVTNRTKKMIPTAGEKKIIKPEYLEEKPFLMKQEPLEDCGSISIKLETDEETVGWTQNLTSNSASINPDMMCAEKAKTCIKMTNNISAADIHGNNVYSLPSTTTPLSPIPTVKNEPSSGFQHEIKTNERRIKLNLSPNTSSTSEDTNSQVPLSIRSKHSSLLARHSNHPKDKVAKENSFSPKVSKVTKENSISPKISKIAKENSISPKISKVAKENSFSPKISTVAKANSSSPKISTVTKENTSSPKISRVAKENSSSPKNSSKSKKRSLCRDYNKKGVCLRGNLCQFYHSDDAVVIPENVEPLQAPPYVPGWPRGFYMSASQPQKYPQKKKKRNMVRERKEKSYEKLLDEYKSLKEESTKHCVPEIAREPKDTKNQIIQEDLEVEDLEELVRIKKEELLSLYDVDNDSVGNSDINLYDDDMTGVTEKFDGEEGEIF